MEVQTQQIKPNTLVPFVLRTKAAVRSVMARKSEHLDHLMTGMARRLRQLDELV